MRKNIALAKLRAGKPICGLTLTLGCPEGAELAARMNLDFLWLDWQHGSWTEECLAKVMPIFLSVDTTPLVRVRGKNAWEINKVLDMGAMGVIVPMVNNREEAETVSRAAKYPPEGNRSGGGVRLPLLADGFDMWDYIRNANDEILVVVMVESIKAIEQAEEIMKVPGVDLVLPGPGDLLIDVRANGGDEADRNRLIGQLLEVGRQMGKPVGFVSSDPEMAKRYLDDGFKFVTLGSDRNALLTSFRSATETAKSWG